MKKSQSLRQKLLAFLRSSPNFNDDTVRKRRQLSAASRIVFGLLILVVVGTLLLMLPGVAAVRPLTLSEAFFTATSALTVTGLSVITAGTDLTFFGQVILLLLIQVGGVGYMFVAALAMRLIGRRLYVLDRIALSSSLGLDTPEAILRVLRNTFYGILVIEGSGALLLYIHWVLSGVMTDFRTPFYALFHAVSAFCNAGFDLFGGLPEYDGIPKDNISLLILASLIYLGGLGIPVLSELVNWRPGKRFSLNTNVTLVVVTILVIVGWVGFLIAEVFHGVLVDVPLSAKIIQPLFQSISARTAGFAGMENYTHIRPATQLLTMVLMFIGCAPASMGGGITTGTFSVLGLALNSYARGQNDVVVAKKTVSANTVRRASAVLTISVGLVMLATFLILLTHELELSTVLFEVISAFATCGLSLGITGELNQFGRVVIAIMMFWGRLGALTIVMAAAQQQFGHQLVQYPEDQILIG